MPFRILALFLNKKRLVEKYERIATKYNEVKCRSVFPQGISKYGSWVMPYDMFDEFVDKFNDVKPEDDKNGLNDDMYEEESENGNFKLKQYRDENGNVYGYSMQWHN